MDTAAAPLLVPVADAAKLLGISRAALYRELGEGRLTARKFGTKTLVARADLDAFAAGLPPATIRPPHRRKAA